ncbi:MAG: C40 family peptidase [Gammaproteobacteria bacterium]
MKLRFHEKTAILIVVGAGLCGCNASLPLLRDEPAATVGAAPSQPAPTAGQGLVGSSSAPRVMFDSENDNFESGSNSALTYALSLTGTRYRYGGTSPSEGFDCSGFVQYVFGHFGVELPRTAHDMAEALPKVDRKALQPGDLVFFNTNGRRFSHVGIYVGNDKFVHAPSTSSKKVMISDLTEDYWSKRLTGLRRPPGQALAVSLLDSNYHIKL